MVWGYIPLLRPEQVISSLYKGILRRHPDKAGKNYYMKLLKRGMPLDKIVQTLVNSAEFDLNRVVSLGPLDALSANAIQFDLSGEQREMLWEHIEKAWSKMGEDEPFYSVINSDRFRHRDISAAAIDQFYNSGEADICRAEEYLSRHGRALPQDGLCVDYGCGVGRVTLWLARRCKRVLAIDVSDAHLRIARQALAERGISNVEFYLLRERSDLSMLKGIDFFYSMIVLQHNPPPLIAEILQHAFEGLNEGASAFFQVPTYGKDYTWNFERYATTNFYDGGMEMHVVPQSVIFSLASRAACLPLEVQPDGCTGLPHWISNTFVFVKPGTSTPI